MADHARDLIRPELQAISPEHNSRVRSLEYLAGLEHELDGQPGLFYARHLGDGEAKGDAPG